MALARKRKYSLLLHWVLGSVNLDNGKATWHTAGRAWKLWDSSCMLELGPWEDELRP